jgi:hypothetical protein
LPIAHYKIDHQAPKALMAIRVAMLSCRGNASLSTAEMRESAQRRFKQGHTLLDGAKRVSSDVQRLLFCTSFTRRIREHDANGDQQRSVAITIHADFGEPLYRKK